MNEIDIDIEDYKTIMAHGGHILEFKSDIFLLDDFNKVIEKFNLELSQAKGIIINFTINSQISLFIINDIMSNIHTIINDDAEVIFGTNTDDTLNTNQIKISIILSGLILNSDNME